MSHPYPLSHQCCVIKYNPKVVENNNSSLKTAIYSMHIQSIGIVIESTYTSETMVQLKMWCPFIQPVTSLNSVIQSFTAQYNETTNKVILIGGIQNSTIEIDSPLSRLNNQITGGLTQLLPNFYSVQQPPSGQNTNNVPSSAQSTKTSKYPTAHGRVADNIVLDPNKKWAR